MANSRSALKRVRQTAVRTARNRSTKTRVKNARKALVQAIEDGDATSAAVRYKELTAVADRAVKANIIHRNSSSRIKRLFSGRVAAIGS